MIRAISLNKLSLVLLGGALLAGSTSCVATRKHVRNTVEPINTKVAGLETKTTEQGQHLDNLDRGVARLDETTKAIDDKATAAGREARAAQDAAAAADAKGVAAQNSANQATELAKATDVKIVDASRRITTLEGNYEYKPVGEPIMVHFGLNKDGLDDEAKAALADVSGKVGSLKRYVVEVQGFTDSTGDANYNLALSQRRAQSVVRYLTSEAKVPLHRVSVLGEGEIVPEKGTRQTRDMRAANRRVEVTLYAAD